MYSVVLRSCNSASDLLDREILTTSDSPRYAADSNVKDALRRGVSTFALPISRFLNHTTVRRSNRACLIAAPVFSLANTRVTGR